MPDECSSSALLEVQLADGLLCTGTVTGEGACHSFTTSDPTTCTWGAELELPSGAVCTVTLTLPDGTTYTQSVVVETWGDDCVMYRKVVFD